MPAHQERKRKKGGLVEVSSGIYERGERWGVSEDVIRELLRTTLVMLYELLQQLLLLRKDLLLLM